MQKQPFTVQLPYDLESAQYDTIQIILPIKPATDETIVEFRNIMYNLHNIIRSQANLPLFQYDNILEFLAQKQSKFMAKDDNLVHTENLGKKITESEYNWKTVGENVAYHTWTGDVDETAEAIFRGWMNSPGHRKNILNANFKDIGIGFWVSNTGLAFSTVIFGAKQERRKPKRPPRERIYFIRQ